MRLAPISHGYTSPVRLPRWFYFALFVLGASSSVFAADTASVSVGAIVLSKNNCKFRSPGSATLAFGNIDPSSSVNATASATLIISCGGASPTVSYVLSRDSGLYAAGINRMKHATLNEYLSYTLVLTPESGMVAKNVDQTINLTGTITPANFQDANVGAYADTVVITLLP